SLVRPICRLLFFHALVDLPPLHPFPTRRSSDLDLTEIRIPALAARRKEFNSARKDLRRNRGVHVTLAEKIYSSRADISQGNDRRSEEHTSELQSRVDLVCRLLLEKKK